MPPTVEEDGRLVLSYFDLFDEVFKQEYERICDKEPVISFDQVTKMRI